MNNSQSNNAKRRRAGTTVVFGAVVSILAALSAGPAAAATQRVKAGQNLQAALDRAASGDTIILSAGSFSANGTEFVDPLCGNCSEHQTAIAATYGFTISGKSLTLLGVNREKSKLITGGGYGLWIVDAPEVTLRNLTITGGVRDSSGDATDAGIVVRNSRVTIERVTVRDNERTDTSVVVGIGGIFGREGAELYIHNCELLNNSWDGVALYRGASAVITDCKIDGGRGAGIGVTWDATCRAIRNEVTGFWKGIGAFGTTWVIAQNNIVHHNLGWGIISTGESYMDISNNVVFSNGNCGVAPWSTAAHGRIVNNIITANGWRKQWVCPCVGVWNYGDWAKWEFSNNIVWGNVDGDYRDIWDQSEINGNLNVDPLFVDTISFRLAEGSPGIDAGRADIGDPDGGKSDIGAYGGPKARE